jgi:hypothetical protein
VAFVSIVFLYSSFAEKLSAIEVPSVDYPLSISFEQVLHFKLELAYLERNRYFVVYFAADNQDLVTLAVLAPISSLTNLILLRFQKLK